MTSAQRAPLRVHHLPIGSHWRSTAGTTAIAAKAACKYVYIGPAAAICILAIGTDFSGERILMTISVIKAVLTDLQFWVPVGVLIIGLLLLAWLH